jgi:multiple sugar transport system permease protein
MTAATRPATGTPDVPDARPPRIRRETIDAWVFLAPAMVGFVLFYVIPTIRGFYFSLTDSNLLKPAKLIGLENYQDILNDKLFWNSLWVTLEYVVINIGLQTVVALLIAVLLDRLTRNTFLRSVMLLPWLLPMVIAAMVFLWLLDYNIGFVNAMLDGLGIDKVAFFGNEAWAIPTIAVINVWRHMGYTALLIFAGLQTIPKDVYEAGSIDGASESQMFRKITVPLLRPILALVLIITVIGSFQVYDTVAVTTDGGPVNATRVIYHYIVDRAFGRFDFGYASALAVALMLILLVVTIIQFRGMRADRSELA